MSRRTDRRSCGSGGSTGAAPALGLAVALLLAACISSGPTITLGERADNFRLTVSVTNVGNGFGRAEVVFSAGPALNPCSEILGPGQSCAPFVRASVRPETADIDVGAEPGSRFVGWTGAHCTGTSTECTVQNTSGEFETVLRLEPRFDLEGG